MVGKNEQNFIFFWTKVFGQKGERNLTSGKMCENYEKSFKCRKLRNFQEVKKHKLALGTNYQKWTTDLEVRRKRKNKRNEWITDMTFIRKKMI